MFSPHCKRALVSIGLAIVPLALQAQQRDQNAGQLEEVIVSVKRYESNLQTTSVAVTAFTEQDLNVMGVSDTRALALFTPSLTIGGDSQLGNFPIVLRGVGNNDSDGPSQDAPIAVYVDGVYQARPFQNSFQMADIERAEVLRGPQGTLFGRNAAGGALNFVSRQPGQETEAFASLGVSRFNTYEVRGYLLTPITDTVGVKLAVGMRDAGGWTRNQANTSESPTEHSDAIRGSVRYKTEDWDLILAGDTGKLNFISAINNPTFFPATGSDEVNLDASQFEERKWSNFSLTANRETGLGTFTGIAAWQSSSDRFSWDADGSVLPLIQFGPLDLDSEAWSLELRLRSSQAQRFRWVAGTYFYKEDGGLAGPVRAGPGFTGLNEYLTVTLFDNDASTRSVSGFGEVYFDVFPRLTLTAGLRYTQDKKTNTNRDLTQPNPVRYSAGDKWTQSTPRFVAEFKATDDVFAYASASKGFRSGTWAISGTSPIPADPETLWSYETGIKTEFLDHRLRVNVAAYYMDYKDKQERVITGIGITETRNATGAKIKGAELEFAVLPIRGLSINGFVNYLEAKFGQFIDFGPGGTAVVLTDKFLPRSPEWKFALLGQYAFSLGNGRQLTPRVEWSHESRSFYSRRNDDLVGTEPWTVVNAKLLLDLDDRWQITTYVDNVTDDRHKNNVSDVVSVGLGTPTLYNAPRQWGARVAFRF